VGTEDQLCRRELRQRHAHRSSYIYIDPYSHADQNRDERTHQHIYPKLHAYGYKRQHGGLVVYRNSNINTHRDAHSNVHRHQDLYEYANLYGHAHADPHVYLDGHTNGNAHFDGGKLRNIRAYKYAGVKLPGCVREPGRAEIDTRPGDHYFYAQYWRYGNDS